MSTFGPAFDEALDGKRVRTQMVRLRDYMLKYSAWSTLQSISLVLGYPQASVSAQLRHLRKQQFGSYQVDKVRLDKGGTWLYRVRPPAEKPNV